MTEKALLIANRGDGPWVPVVDLDMIDIDGLEPGDCLEIMHENEDTLSFTEDGIHQVNLRDGKIRAVRRIGDSQLTVRALENGA